MIGRHFRWSAAALLAASALGACTRDSVEQKAAALSEDALIVPGQRVGPFVLGRETLASILGEDTPEARRKFTEQGLHFQFERGGSLTGITVMSERYATVEGLCAGMPPAEVEAALGEPQRRGGSAVLAYAGITFYHVDDKVVGIHVAAP